MDGVKRAGINSMLIEDPTSGQRFFILCTDCIENITRPLFPAKPNSAVVRVKDPEPESYTSFAEARAAGWVEMEEGKWLCPACALRWVAEEEGVNYEQRLKDLADLAMFYFRFYHGIQSPDEVEPTDVPGYWRVKAGCPGGALGPCNGKTELTLHFEEHNAIENGRFVSPRRAWYAWKELYGGKKEREEC